MSLNLYYSLASKYPEIQEPQIERVFVLVEESRKTLMVQLRSKQNHSLQTLLLDVEIYQAEPA